jgi:hypothetical protein
MVDRVCDPDYLRLPKRHNEATKIGRTKASACRTEELMR